VGDPGSGAGADPEEPGEETEAATGEAGGIAAGDASGQRAAGETAVGGAELFW